MQVDDLCNFTLFFEDVEGLIKGQAIFGDFEGQNIALSIECHIIHTVEDVFDVPCYLAVVLPLVEVNQLLNRA